MRAHAELENSNAAMRAISRTRTNSRSTSSSPNCWASGTASNSATARQDAGADVQSCAKGTELTLKMLGNAMASSASSRSTRSTSRSIRSFHQAMSMQPRADVPRTPWWRSCRRATPLNGRLVRPAMVMVSQAAPGDPLKAQRQQPHLNNSCKRFPESEIQTSWARSSASTSAPPTPAWRSWRAARPRSSRTAKAIARRRRSSPIPTTARCWSARAPSARP